MTLGYIPRRLRSIVRRILLYNLVMTPFITLVYLPYYVFVIHYSFEQLISWLATTLPMAIIANLVIQPVVSRVVKWIK